MVAQDPIARRGRRVGWLVFGAWVGGVTLLFSSQIVRQGFASAPAGGVACRAGVQDLVASLSRARQAAAREVGGERVAVARFRSALLPEWDRRSALDDACRADPKALELLKALDRLRYAEEHAVRYEAVDLARDRRTVDSLTKELFVAPAGS